MLVYIFGPAFFGSKSKRSKILSGKAWAEWSGAVLQSNLGKWFFVCSWDVWCSHCQFIVNLMDFSLTLSSTKWVIRLRRGRTIGAVFWGYNPDFESDSLGVGLSSYKNIAGDVLTSLVRFERRENSIQMKVCYRRMIQLVAKSRNFGRAVTDFHIIDSLVEQ